MIISQLLTAWCHSPTSVKFPELNYAHEWRYWLVKYMLFLRVLEGTFVLTIISLCSNANNVGDLKILTPKFFFYYCRVSKGKITMCCTRISHVYRFDIHLKCDKWNFAIHSSMNCTAFTSTAQQISALTSTKYTHIAWILYMTYFVYFYSAFSCESSAQLYVWQTVLEGTFFYRLK